MLPKPEVLYIDDSLASSTVTVLFCDDIVNDSIPLIALDTPTLISHKMMDEVVKVHGDENVPQWLNPLVARLLSERTKSSVVCPKDDSGTSGFLFAKHAGLKLVLSQLDGLSLRAKRWETDELFKEATHHHKLKTLKSVIVQIYEPTSFFSGTYDMMSGRVLYCLSGCRLFVGIPFKTALEACEADTGEEVTCIAQLACWIKAQCSLEKVTETGFYAFLRAGEVLVVPPAFFVLECCLCARIGTPPCSETCSIPEELHTSWHNSLSNFKKILPQEHAKTFSARANVLTDLIYMTAVKVEPTEAAEAASTTLIEVAVLPELDEGEYNSLRSQIEKLDDQQILARISDIKKRSDFPAFAKFLLAETQDQNAVSSFGTEDALEDLIEFETWLLRKEHATSAQQPPASATGAGAAPANAEIIQSQLPQASVQHPTAEQVQEAEPSAQLAQHQHPTTKQVDETSATEQVQEATPQHPNTEQVQVQEASLQHPTTEQVQEATSQHYTTEQVEEASAQHYTTGQVQEASEQHYNTEQSEQVEEASVQHYTTEQVQEASEQHLTTKQVQETSAQHNTTPEQQDAPNTEHVSQIGHEGTQPEPVPADLMSTHQNGDEPDPCAFGKLHIADGEGEATATVPEVPQTDAMKQKQHQFFDPSTYTGKTLLLPPPEKMGKSDQPQTLTPSAKTAFFDTATYHSKSSGLPCVPAGKLVSTEVPSTADEKRAFFGPDSKEKPQHQVDISKSQEAQSLAAKAELAVKQHLLRARGSNADDTSQAHRHFFW